LYGFHPFFPSRSWQADLFSSRLYINKSVVVFYLSQIPPPLLIVPKTTLHPESRTITPHVEVNFLPLRRSKTQRLEPLRVLQQKPSHAMGQPIPPTLGLDPPSLFSPITHREQCPRSWPKQPSSLCSGRKCTPRPI